MNHFLNLFRNLKIAHQFLIVFGILIIGFVAVGLAYKQVLDVEGASATRIQEINQFGDLVSRVSGDAAAMTAYQTSFLLNEDLQDVERFGEQLAQAQQKVDVLEETAPDDQVRGLVSQVRDALVSNEEAFDSLVDTMVLVGLTDNSGLRGEIIAAARAVEASVRGTTGHDDLLVSLLQMRRHEKNYMMRRDRQWADLVTKEQAIFVDLVAGTGIPDEVKASITSEIGSYAKAFQAFVEATGRVETKMDDLQTEQLVLQPLLDSLVEQKESLITAGLAQVAGERAKITVFFVGALVAAGTVVAAVLLLLARRMRRSLWKLGDTVQKVAQGDFAARSRLATSDELGELGDAFDHLLDERLSTLSKAEQENDRLNDSIITLMAAVGQLSQKDLTVKAVVAEDVTGPVADAVNLMASETRKVLNRIREVSQQVEQAASAVRVQAEKVAEVAAQERRLVQESADELRQAGDTMTQLAKEAGGADELAAVAMDHTRNALAAVSTTVGGMEQIREIIRETEKRIKRLGERSQEITGAVNLINTIAERTHILALNARMHAASAGEAGRGFGVVADEVQRLAESSRAATSDIASMVNAIRVETVDTVDTMNRVIVQVAEGTRLAQEAGQKMGDTESTTARLVAAVQHIAGASEQQAGHALDLMRRSQIILKSTEQTGAELEEQSAHTVSLVDYSNALRESVAVFKLSAAAA